MFPRFIGRQRFTKKAGLIGTINHKCFITNPDDDSRLASRLTAQLVSRVKNRIQAAFEDVSFPCLHVSNVFSITCFVLISESLLA